MLVTIGQIVGMALYHRSHTTLLKLGLRVATKVERDKRDIESYYSKQNASEYDHEMPQSQTADQPTV